MSTPWLTPGCHPSVLCGFVCASMYRCRWWCGPSQSPPLTGAPPLASSPAWGWGGADRASGEGHAPIHTLMGLSLVSWNSVLSSMSHCLPVVSCLHTLTVTGSPDSSLTCPPVLSFLLTIMDCPPPSAWLPPPSRPWCPPCALLPLCRPPPLWSPPPPLLRLLTAPPDSPSGPPPTAPSTPEALLPCALPVSPLCILWWWGCGVVRVARPRPFT